ncbi:flagellar motor switch protein FliN/FliY [Georgenia satyanarayanai]|uniref:Flagellar motor switch protein FliN/FliY n=1 Tax=Georgenia satyanarayanai TaxID=860221 RepID=A0A2Y9A9R7_9MICO|nr:flagellar motor switch protein FliN [Georgenia satyanarayanai]PYG01060.1 flagellar motor switch protein FliN/FliY [Georgenia satyanarayanai]SSA39299.1 flagellar motor switch protein FliN/FliY [Georgenia satyanarayanai]
MSTTTVDTHAVAEELARLLPSSQPLVARPAEAGERPAPEAVAVVASFVGQGSAELVVVAEEAVAEAMAGAAALTLAEALRPALEAASQQLGAGVLSAAEERPAGDALTGRDVQLFALTSGSGVQAWFGIRTVSTVAPVSSAPLTPGSMRVLYDVELTLTTEIGRTRMPLRDVLALTPGTVLELDRAAGSPADVMVNGRLVARGDVVVVDEDYAVRITEIVSETAAQ